MAEETNLPHCTRTGTGTGTGTGTVSLLRTQGLRWEQQPVALLRATEDGTAIVCETEAIAGGTFDAFREEIIVDLTFDVEGPCSVEGEVIDKEQRVRNHNDLIRERENF
ncbi:unnamed protein product [Diplocarpon coronariae]|uniref:Uncharacterized protein n=1 Tax=Diplocarpon coronariae TaxID=2795749 RepID=A0A218ZHY2_9HELO|nr:hypothetical protein B2J93_6181 [Marssonina coronariae]